MFEKAKISNSTTIGKDKYQISKVWKSQRVEFQCFEKGTFRIPMFGKGKVQNSKEAKIQNYNVWKKLRFRIPVFGKGQNLDFQCLKEAKVQNSNVCKKAKFRNQMFGKSQSQEFWCLEKAKIQNCNVWKSQSLEF